MLAYVAARTDLVEQRGTRFVATAAYAPAARYLIDLYAGAFGASAAQLPRLLREPTRAAAAVDRGRHARAFEAVAGPAALGAVPGLIRQLGLGGLLDLGCGTGALLIELARRDGALAGWGLERNPTMARCARRAVRAAQLERRLGRARGRIHRETLLQDYVQVLSGQGVPPPDAAAWEAIYRRARCRLVHAIEDRATTRFIHVARLA
jgi:SAM-dependent methyltransferase